MALDNAKNFAKVTASTGYNSTDTSIVLQSGHGAKLPTAPFNVTWWNATDYPDPSDDPNVEIVRVTAISTDTLTVTRAQESTSGSTKNTSGKTYQMIAGITAKVINTDIAGLGATGIGWSLKEYQAVTAAANITSGTLNLSTDLHYRITIECEGDNTNIGFRCQINGIATSTYEILGHRIYTLAAGTTDGVVNQVGSPVNGWQLDAGLAAYGRHQAVIEITLKKTNGTALCPVINFQSGGYGSSGNRSDDMYRYVGSGLETSQTNVTSISFYTSGGQNRDWKMWIEKLTTS